MLCITNKATAASCSKGPQGLSFPLDDTGLFTSRVCSEVSD